MRVCVTGATGFVGGHVARMLRERGDSVRATYRAEQRLGRLARLDVEPVRADVLDRAALRRAFRGCELVFHCAGVVAARPVRRVYDVNARSPRLALEAAAAEGVRRVVLTSSVAGIGPQPRGEVGDERAVYRGGQLGLAYPDAKHEGEAQALGAAARLGIDLVIVNPSYVLGVPVDRTQPGETSTRTIGNYLAGRLPAVVDGEANIVDVEDVARGHLLAAERGARGERYVLGGHDARWVEVIDRVARLSGERRELLVIPPELAAVVRAGESLGIGLPAFRAGEALTLMAQSWRYSSGRARRELGYSARPLDVTLSATIDWYRELMAAGAFPGPRGSTFRALSAGVRAGRRMGLLAALRALEPHAGRRLVAGAQR